MAHHIVNTGGPAFPTPEAEVDGIIRPASQGMTVLDMFASNVVAAMVATNGVPVPEDRERPWIEAYALADAGVRVRARLNK